MSRYIATCATERFIYGFDNCGLPGYFAEDAGGTMYDTRDFMADDGCHRSKGQMVELLEARREAGFNIPKDHIMKMALDLPF